MAVDSMKLALGIDIGGTGIKGGIVDVERGALTCDRFRLDTPRPAVPGAVARAVSAVAGHFDFTGPVGVDFPAVILDGVVQTAANIDKSWVGTSLAETIGSRLSGRAVFLNDADAAGLAEVRYGAGRGRRGLVIVVTFGTGIGIALVHDGKLIPNAELGHLRIGRYDAESRSAASARARDGLSWPQWAKRASKYLQTLETLLWPELFIFGGGITRNPEKWVPLLKARTPFVVAQLINNAGIVGAASFAYRAAEDVSPVLV
jgi:polyphosphate glucokinase